MANGESGLTRQEIDKLVYRYIGVNGGYLGDFSYASHHAFYLDLDLDINPYQFSGTTRARFMSILSTSPPHVQARILEGILTRFPLHSAGLRTQERVDEISRWITRLRGTAPVSSPEPSITSEVVSRALADAEALLKSTGATSGVDRAHTALHGYLRAVCQRAGIQYGAGTTPAELFNLIRSKHEAFHEAGARHDDIAKILRAQATILDVLNPVRNMASVAHPNELLLKPSEAMLAINTARTILIYIDSKLIAFVEAHS